MIVLVTGCNSQIGRAVTKKYAKNGHTVIATDSTEVDFLNRNIHEFEMNIRSKNAIRSVKETVAAEFGSIDILINCTISDGGGSIKDTLLGDIKEVYETNIYTIKRVLDVFYDMLNESSDGYFVNLSMYNIDRMADNNVYLSTEEAMKSILASLQSELDTITVLSIEPSLSDNYRQKICGKISKTLPSQEPRVTELFIKSPEQVANITYCSTQSNSEPKTKSMIQKIPFNKNVYELTN